MGAELSNFVSAGTSLQSGGTHPPYMGWCDNRYFYCIRSGIRIYYIKANHTKGVERMSFVKITKENFDELVIRSAKPVLLDFWAPWCGPCRMVAPVVEEIAAEREDILVGKVNVDEEMELAMQFGVASIPTLVVMKGGKAAAKAVGYRPKSDILKLLEK